MRHGTTNRRQRNRSNGPSRRGGQQKMQVFDSNGPDVRIRGTAHQVTEKYLTLAKDAASSGDRTLAENYLQHAEHYQRIINSWVQEETNNFEDDQSDDARGNKATQNTFEKESDDADLSLPASILGGNSKSKSQERTAEATA